MIRRGVLAVVAACVLAACAGGGSPPAVPGPADSTPGTVLLSRTEGWRAGLPGTMDPYVLVEVAYDARTAQRAWAENVPADAGTRATPYEDGRSGSLTDVDLARQRIVVVSTGTSGSCPGWIRGLALGADGKVDVFSAAHVPPPADACTADYRPYRTVLAVDADRLPARAALGDGVTGLLDGSDQVGGGVLVVPYPFAPS